MASLDTLVYPAQLFAQSITTPAMVSAQQMTPPPSSYDPTTTIKMEDLNKPVGHSTPSNNSTSTSQSTSTPPATEQKPVKKRKSWGQVLPEPKTNLPPRKRAKTEDEKEQRRIERVKRNRLAAHNSRERKRQEVEQLQQEKDKLEEELKACKGTMARMAAQLKAFQQRHPEEYIELENEFDYNTPSPSDFARESSETICPRQTSFPSPISMDSMNSPRDDSCQPETPSYTDSVTPELDQTRYPAVSVELGADMPSALLATGDSGFPYSLQSHTTLDEKPIMEDLFNFNDFPETHDGTQSTSPLDVASSFTTSFFETLAPNAYGLSDSFDAKCFDLQTTSGAANASDGVIASEH